MPSQPSPPDRGYSFTDHSVSQPSVPQPGDHLDAEFDRSNTAIEDLIGWVAVSLNPDGTLKPLTVGEPQLSVDLVSSITAQVVANIQPYVSAAASSAGEAQISEAAAASSAATAQGSAVGVGGYASTASAAAAAATAASAAAQDAQTAAEAAALAAASDANAAETSANLAQKDRELAGAWAEYLDGNNPIPNSFFAHTAVTGSHWSARWWSTLGGGGGGGGGGGPTLLNDLIDVDTGVPGDAFVLTWNNASSKWIAASGAGGGGGGGGLPIAGDGLEYSGGSTLQVHAPLPANLGGTGQIGYSVGDLLYASDGATLSKLAAGASGTVLLGGATPSYGKITLTSHVSGVLPVANGGTGASSFPQFSILMGNLTGAVQSITPTSVPGVPLVSSVPGIAPTFGAINVGSSSAVVGILSVTNGGTGRNALTNNALLVGANAGAVQQIAPATDGVPLLAQGPGSLPAYVALNLGGGGVTGVTPVAKGGTGLATLTQYNVLIGNGGTNPLSLVAPGVTGIPLVSQGVAANPAFSAINLANTSATTGALPVSRGGTGITNDIKVETLNYVLDGGSQVLVAGSKGYLKVDYDCTIEAWELVANTTGTLRVTVGAGTYSSFPTLDPITGATPPSLSSAQKAQGTPGADGWTATAIAAGTWLEFSVAASPAPAAIFRATIALKVRRT